jgi:hypothetical protein
MPNRTFEEPKPLAELISFGAGDVLAVRAFAETLLRTQDLSDPAYRDARLIMTAACLQLQSRAARAPTTADLRELLVNLETSADFRSILGASPMQFLQFAAAEIDALDPAVREDALSLCLRACPSAGPV